MRLEWNAVGTRFYEAGVDQGVLYVAGQPGVVWTGLTSVEETPSGGEAKAYYIDGVKYLNISTAEEFGATVNAFTYPDEFAECDGSVRVRPGLLLTQQRRKSFGLSYRTMVGNDQNSAFGYKIHLVYNALASPSQQSHSTINESTDPSEFSWTLTTRPPAMSGFKRSAHIVIDSREVHPARMKAVEDILYGSDTETARLPELSELIEIFDTPVELEVVNDGSNLFTISGTNEMVRMLDEITAEITGPTIVAIDENTYSITSP